MSMTGVQYPCPSSGDERVFRLLTISGRDEQGYIKCRMFPVSLVQLELSYIAISYTWSREQSHPTNLIVVNEHYYAVHRNVLDLLEQSYASNDRTPMFIDAICIDQTNVLEKSTHVSLMGEIYYNAWKVVIWLGIFPSSLQSDFEALLSLRHHHGCDKMFSNQRDVRFLTESEAIRWIATHRYWTRLWIVQELMLAQDINLRTSSISVDMEILLDWFDFDVVMSSGEPNHMERASNILRWRERLDDLYPDRRKSLPVVDAMMSFGVQECSDRRDKLFGLLALVNSGMLPDYSKTVQEIFLEIASAGLHEIKARDDPEISAAILGLDLDEQDMDKIMRTWCTKLSNIFGMDVNTLNDLIVT